MCNRCSNPNYGYWTQKWLQIPYCCTNCSIAEVCLNCPHFVDNKKEDGNAQSNKAHGEIGSVFFKSDPQDYYWSGRCKIDRAHKNSFTSHFRIPNSRRHPGEMDSLKHRTICTPRFMKHFLLSANCKKCFYQPEMDDPFESVRLTGTNNLDQHIPFLWNNLDSRVGRWLDAHLDEFGNPNIDDDSVQRMLMKSPQDEHYLSYENIDKKWLNKFCEFYEEVASNGTEMDEISPSLEEICVERKTSNRACEI